MRAVICGFRTECRLQAMSAFGRCSSHHERLNLFDKHQSVIVELRMKKPVVFMAVMLFSIFGVYSQTQAVTSDGRNVTLYEDGTWEYSGENIDPIETAWSSSTATDPLTDETRTVLTVTPTERRSRFGRQSTLVLRKTGETTEMYINWGTYLGLSSDMQEVSYRIDQESAVSAMMTLSTNSESSFFSTGVAISTIHRMLGADTLVARTTPYGQSPITAVFPITGLRSIVESTPHLSDWLDG